MIVLSVLIVLAGFVFILRKKFRKPPVQEADRSTTLPVPVPGESSSSPGPVSTEKDHRSAIYLFGQFQVFDKEGNDITRLFTPLLKELFLIIVLYTIRNGRGISSEGLNEILWHDKPEKDAKNNRSVNLAKLKAILEKIGNGVISKESAYWQFAIPDDDIYVDYKKYVSLLQHASDSGKEYIRPLVDIIKRGAFLSQTEYDWLDDIKSDISNSVLDLCLGYIKNISISKDPEFIIEITNCIFYFDQVNEDALTYKCKSLILLRRHTLANNTYLKFLKEYKDIYGTDLGKSFQEIIA
jgi:two-component SAPR family response regulator